MESTLAFLAEKIMDAYYGDYKHQDDFFDIEDFTYYASIAYASLLQDDFEKIKQEARQEGVTGVQFNPDWYKVELLQAKRDPVSGNWYVVLDRKPFSFRYDRSYSSIENISATSGSCQDFIRTEAKRTWMQRRIPKTSKVFWYPEAKRIVFVNVQCSLKEVRVVYIPSLADLAGDAPVPESMQDQILKKTLAFMLDVRKGVVVDETADGNKNRIHETEINPDYPKK